MHSEANAWLSRSLGDHRNHARSTVRVPEIASFAVVGGARWKLPGRVACIRVTLTCARDYATAKELLYTVDAPVWTMLPLFKAGTPGPCRG